MKNLTFYLLAFSFIILAAKLSAEPLPKSEHHPSPFKSTASKIFAVLWKIIMSPFTLMYTAMDYATLLGEKSGASLYYWYQAHFNKQTTPAPESNDIPPFIKSTNALEQDGNKRGKLLQRINDWIKTKKDRFTRKITQNDSSTPNTTDWQYPSDLSDESVQDNNGITWFMSQRKLNFNDLNTIENTNETVTEDMTTANTTSDKVKILSAAKAKLKRAREAMREKMAKLKAKGRRAYDWVLWKLLAAHSKLPKLIGRRNSTQNHTSHSNGLDLNFNHPLNSTASFVCDDVPSPVCAVDDDRGFTIFLNPCMVSLFNYNHQSNFTIYPTDVCMGLFIRSPDRFYQSKKE